MLLIIPNLIPLMFLWAGLEYLRRSLLPEVSPTVPVGEPYTLPFTGGQCSIQYGVTYRAVDTFGYVRFYTGNGTNTSVNPPPWNDAFIRASSGTTYLGAISPSDVSFDNTFGNGRIIFRGNAIISTSSPLASVAIYRVVTASGAADNCGDLSNPVPPPPVASDGLADNSPLEIEDDDLVVEGAPIVPYNPLTAAIAALLAALKAASDLKDAIDFIGDMLDKIGKGIDEVKDWLDDKNKNPDSGKDIKRHDYGSIRKDGFLRLYPDGADGNFTPEYLDLQLLSIPIGYGKYFGNLSPNFYRFKSLGYISFVSPTFGNLETIEIEFSRCSVNVPPNAYGFFYHLGLEDVIRANVSLFYSIDKVEDE